MATTASTGKHSALRELGADLVIERSPADWLTPLMHWATEGVDVVLDVVGELDLNVRAVRVGGRIVQVGTMGAAQVSFSLGAMLPKRATLVGTVLRARPLEEKISLSRRFAREVLPFFDAGQLHPVIDSRYGLDGIAAAHRHMESNANVGKIVIDV